MREKFKNLPAPLHAFLCFLVPAIITIVLCTACSSTSVSGNRVTYGKDYQTFEYAYIILGDKIIAEGPITQWRDYQSGDEIQIMIGGRVYLTHYSNVVMCTSASVEQSYSSYQDYNSTN